ncbi:hypothetical protein ABPG72_000073 [Tetrahymena utriculariae]
MRYINTSVVSSIFDHSINISNNLEISKSDEANEEFFSFQKSQKNPQMPRVHPLIKQKKNKEKSISQSGDQLLTQFSPSLSNFSNQTTNQKTPYSKLFYNESKKKINNNLPNYQESLISLSNNIKSLKENIIENKQFQLNQEENQAKFEFSIDLLAAIEQQLFQLKEYIQRYQDEEQKDQPSQFNQSPLIQQNQFLQYKCNGKIISSVNLQQQKSPNQKIQNDTSIQPICQNNNFRSLYIQLTQELNQSQIQLAEEMKQKQKLQEDLKQLEQTLGGLQQQLIESQKNQKNMKENFDYEIQKFMRENSVIQMKLNNQNLRKYEDSCNGGNMDNAFNVLIQLKEQEYQLLQNKYNDLNKNYLEIQHSLEVKNKEQQKKNILFDEKSKEISEWKLKYQSLNKQILVMPNYSIELRYQNQKISDLEKRIRELVEQNEKLKMENVNLEIENKKYLEIRILYEKLSKDYIQMKQDIIVLRIIQKQFQDFLSETQKENDRLYSNDYLFSLASSTNRNLNSTFKDQNIQEEDQIIEVSKYNNSDSNQNSFKEEVQNNINSNQNFGEGLGTKNVNCQEVNKNDNINNQLSQCYSHNPTKQDHLKERISTQDNEIDNYISQLQQQLSEYKSKLLHLQENQPNKTDNQTRAQNCFNQDQHIQVVQNEDSDLIVNLNDQIAQLEIILKEKNNLLEQSFNEKMQMLSELTQIKEREKLLMKGNENLQQMYLQIRSEFESSCIKDKANSEKIELYEENLQKLQSQYLEILEKYQEILQKQEQKNQNSLEKRENKDLINQENYVQSVEFSSQNQTQVSKAVKVCFNKNIQDDFDINQSAEVNHIGSKRKSQEQITLIESESIIQSKDLKNPIQDTEQLNQSENQKSAYQESQIQQLKTIVKNGRNEIEQLYQVLNQRKNEIDQLQLTINQKDVENEKLSQQIQVLILEIESQQNQLKQMSQDIQEITKLKNKFQQQADRYFLEAVKKNKELIEATEICNVMRAKYEDALQNIEDLESRIILQTETQQNI